MSVFVEESQIAQLCSTMVLLSNKLTDFWNFTSQNHNMIMSDAVVVGSGNFYHLDSLMCTDIALYNKSQACFEMSGVFSHKKKKKKVAFQILTLTISKVIVTDL